MISVRLFSNACVDDDPTALKFAIVIVTHSDQQMPGRMFHLDEVLLLHIELWETFDRRSRHNPLFATVDFAPHQYVFVAILPKHPSHSWPWIVGIRNRRKQQASHRKRDGPISESVHE